MPHPWSHRLLGRSVLRWLSVGRKHLRQRAPVRPCLEQLEKRELLSNIPFPVSDIRPGIGGSYPTDLANVSGTLFFQANDGNTGYELWKSNGSSAGTILVKDFKAIYPGANGIYPTHLTNVNGTLFFMGFDPVHSKELWKSDGTSSGTVLVKDINPGSSNYSYPEGLTNVNGTLFFTANDGSHGCELWKSDGTSSGTVLIKDIFPGNEGSYPGGLTNVNGTLFFGANDGSHGYELWKSDGTSAGTSMVKDINPGSAGRAYGLTSINGTLFFAANDGSTGYELWKSDGTSSGTALFKDINPGSGSSSPFNLTNVSGTLVFTANDGSHGAELFKSDGTSAGTALVKDIYPGVGRSNPSGLTNVNGTLFFSAIETLHGYELWKSDGTSAGTVLVKDIRPGSAGSLNSFYALTLTDVSGALFFEANDGSHGRELWQSDGTSAGTVMTQDINPGSASGLQFSITPLANVNGALFFPANDGSHGNELWALGVTPPSPPPPPPPPGPTLTSLSPNPAVEGSAAFTLTVTGSNFDGTAIVLWGGTPLTTTFTTATQLQAQVPATLLAEEGSATVSVTEDSGTSNGLVFAVADAPLGGLSIHNPNATAGVSTGTFTVATFHGCRRLGRRQHVRRRGSGPGRRRLRRAGLPHLRRGGPLQPLGHDHRRRRLPAQRRHRHQRRRQLAFPARLLIPPVAE